MSHYSRRKFLTIGAGGTVAAALWPRHGALAQPAQAALEIVPLGNDLVQITGAGGNVVALTTAEGVVLVDGGTAARAPRLLSLVGEVSAGREIVAALNTHWHLGHTGSNEMLGARGTRIVAHENTRLWLGGDFYVAWEDRRYRPRPAEALPTDTFYESGDMTVAGRPVRYAHLPRAHTDGDLYVFFPDANVLVAGDTLSVGRYPILDYSTGGWLGGLIDANETLLDLVDDETRIVPGTGPVQSRADLNAQRDMLSTVMERLSQMLAEGMSAREMMAATPTAEFDAHWGDPELFIANAYEGLWGHVYALDPRPI